MAKHKNPVVEKQLDTVIDLLQTLVALELSKSGVARDVIAKRLHVAKAAVVGMLKGVTGGQRTS